MERIHIKVYGRVQGVFFRAYTQKEAQRLNVTGFVKNTSDGGVEIIAEGSRNALEKLASWCKHGPPSANVDKIETKWLPATGEFSGFSITY